MNFDKQSGLKRKLIDQTLNLGKKILKKEKLKLSEKITNFLCENLVRKKINPPSNIYTWWSYRSPDFTKNNRGRRLDHIWCSENISKKVCDVKIHKETRSWDKPSDHVPIGIIIET